MNKSSAAQFFFPLLFSFCAIVSFGQDSEHSSWELVNEEKGIEVFSRMGQDSSLKEIRIICTVKTTMDHMADFLSDVSLYSDWVYKCDSSSLLEKVNESKFSYYITLDFPFPFANRDLAVDTHHSIDSFTGIYQSHSIAIKVPENENDSFVHINEFESSWTITPLPSGDLHIDYQSRSNPGGDIPVWLVNLAITKGPYETMKRFVHMVEKD
ncbi:MAG: hypothetical protein ACJAVY_001180 [Marinoscillum sp.]|jgi:hypothetical protein